MFVENFIISEINVFLKIIFLEKTNTMQNSTLKLFLIAIFLFNLQHISIAQKQECGTELPPNFNLQKNKNPEHFQKFMEKFNNEFLNRPPTAGSCINDIPMKVHIIRRTNGTGGLTVAQLTTAMTTLNLRYEAACMAFYVCGDINYIDDDQYYNFDTSDEGALTSANNVANAINIYYANSVGNGTSNYCGYAYYPGGQDVILMANSCALNGSTLPHEVGHFYGLPHTHNGGNELVNGSNCATAGDDFCDTAADPNLSGLVNSSCVYTGTLTDANGDLYVPDPMNIMSYSRKPCRTFFSTEQLAEIVYNNTFTRNYFDCPDFDVDFTADKTFSCANSATINFTETAVGETSYEWDFDNDGTIDATSANPSHTYTSPGEYEVNLTVSNGTFSIAKVKTKYIRIGADAFPHSSDFDNFLVGTNATGFDNGWTTTPSGTTSAYRWNTNKGTTPSNDTGPSVDQSLGNSNGVYIFSEATNSSSGDIAELISPCLDVPASSSNPSVSFYYHMYGSGMGTLHIDLNDGNTWINDITSPIVGQQHTSSSAPWSENTFDISSYKGSTIQIRFRAERGSSFRSDMGIDNLQLLELFPLPVELVKFNGSENDKGEHLLNWQTASEENASHFLLEHSKDGIQFETLGKIKANGNSTTPIDYRFTNFFPSQPDNYYRLKIIDFDEKFEYSSVIYLASAKQNSEITIFPNPSHGVFQFNRPGDKNKWQLKIFNTVGQMVKEVEWQKNETTFDLNLEDFPNGIYNIQIINRNNVVEMKRLVKM